MKYTMDNFLLDVNSGIELRPWQAARIEITGKSDGTLVRKKEQEVVEEIETITGTGSDSEKLFSDLLTDVHVMVKEISIS